MIKLSTAFTLPTFTLLALSLAACTDDPDTIDTPRTAVSAPLAGAWFTGSLSSIQYYDRDTGAWQNPSGEGFYFVFDDDGDYETGAVIDSTVSGCNLRLLGAEVGTVEQDGDLLTVHRHWITTHVTNTCGDDGDRTQGQETRTMRWSVARDGSGLEWLSLEHTDGSIEQYRRWQ